MTGAFGGSICFTRLAYPIADRKGIQVELAGFISLHSRPRITRFAGADSTSPAMDCKKPSHGTAVFSCSGPKAIGSCFCILLFRPGLETFQGGHVTHIRASNGLTGSECAGSGGAAAVGATTPNATNVSGHTLSVIISSRVVSFWLLQVRCDMWSGSKTIIGIISQNKVSLLLTESFDFYLRCRWALQQRDREGRQQRICNRSCGSCENWWWIGIIWRWWRSDTARHGLHDTKEQTG